MPFPVGCAQLAFVDFAHGITPQIVNPFQGAWAFVMGQPISAPGQNCVAVACYSSLLAADVDESVESGHRKHVADLILHVLENQFAALLPDFEVEFDQFVQVFTANTLQQL